MQRAVVELQGVSKKVVIPVATPNVVVGDTTIGGVAVSAMISLLPLVELEEEVLVVPEVEVELPEVVVEVPAAVVE
jgi:hypothetical protein